MAVFRFAPTPQSVPAARRHVREQLDALGVDAAVTETAMLLVSELVTNVALHARSEGRLSITVDGAHLQVRVADGAPGRPRLRRYASTESTGRGLRFVEGLAAQWGVERTTEVAAGGKAVWFQLTLAPSPEEQAAQEASSAALFDVGPGSWADAG